MQSKAIPAQKTKGGRAQNKNPEYMPSPAAERVLPKIDDALKEKIAKATKPKGEPGKRGVSSTTDMEDWDLQFNESIMRQLHTYSRLALGPLEKGPSSITCRKISARLRPNILPIMSGSVLRLIRFARCIV